MSLNTKILKIEPFTVEEGGKVISEAHVKLQFEIGIIEVNIYLKKYFFNKDASSKWGGNKKLIESLTGKSALVELKFINLTPFTKISENKKSVVQKNDSANNTTIIGKLIEKKEYAPSEYSIKELCPDPTKFEQIVVDCGVKVTAGVKKRLFNKGDFVTASGILQADLKKVGGKKL